MRTLKHSIFVPYLLPFLLAAACGGSKAPAPVPAPPPKPEPAPVSEPPPPPAPVDTSAVLIEEAKKFVADTDKELRTLDVDAAVAEWANETDITTEHEKTAAEKGEALAKATTRLIKAAQKFAPVMDKLDPDTRRQLVLLRVSGQPAPDDPAQSKELAELQTEMTSVYGKGKVCDTSKPKKGVPTQADIDAYDAKIKGAKDDAERTKLTKARDEATAKFNGAYCKDLDALEKIMRESHKPDELLKAWQGWHDTVGRQERPLFTRYVELANIGARAVGFKDVAELWKSGYDMPPDAFETEVNRLWDQVKPLYTQLHCYARRKLNKLYGDKVVPKGGPIPAHMTGNMWAQEWEYLADELEPYKGIAPINVTPVLAKKLDAKAMVKMGESFYTSLGMPALPATFWERSMFEKPKGKEAVCHASAWDVTYSNDLRIKMCINRNQEDLFTIHHELGHDYYFTHYYKLPTLYQNGANDGFHEAIGDTVMLSMTPDYLKQKGLIDKVVKSEKATINAQMARALERFTFLPWGLLVDKWRWDVFSGKTKPDQYNTHWWELRLKYQGIAPPIPRSEADFDPGAKYHVATNTSYMRYFVARILQFQFYRALCKTAGHTGPLHECSFYGNKTAGDAFSQMLSLGASKPWQEALYQLTGERSMDASAVLDYFAPLQKWLEEQNKGDTCGW